MSRPTFLGGGALLTSIGSDWFPTSLVGRIGEKETWQRFGRGVVPHLGVRLILGFGSDSVEVLGHARIGPVEIPIWNSDFWELRNLEFWFWFRNSDIFFRLGLYSDPWIEEWGFFRYFLVFFSRFWFLFSYSIRILLSEQNQLLCWIGQ